MANPSDNASAKLRIIRAIHPDRDANFRAIASSQQDIKKAQKLVLVACTQCLKTDGRLRKCSKVRVFSYITQYSRLTSRQCKGVWYCSKEVRLYQLCSPILFVYFDINSVRSKIGMYLSRLTLASTSSIYHSLRTIGLFIRKCVVKVLVSSN